MWFLFAFLSIVVHVHLFVDATLFLVEVLQKGSIALVGIFYLIHKLAHGSKLGIQPHDPDHNDVGGSKQVAKQSCLAYNILSLFSALGCIGIRNGLRKTFGGVL